ncbi:MAG: hypothetical protein AB7F22_27525 [Reyranella sp.]|uniref:hypothetical protein n=1 Tax=Reyranella sp. TaxID=1929291 RepID=UPI003D1140A3
MIRTISRAAVAVVGVMAVSACTLGKASTSAPASRPPAADYQMASAAPPPAGSTRSICYNTQDIAIFRARMVQMELNVATLQCQNPSGARAYETLYGNFLAKFRSDLAANGRAIQDLARRKRSNVDVVVTEFANRTAQRAPTDKEFCARAKRAFDWALSQQVTTLTQVPPPYDLGPDMNVHPCAAP